MTKFRETICKYYISRGSYEKNRDAEYKGFCQHCTKYEPRLREKHENRKRKYNDKVRSQIYED